MQPSTYQTITGQEFQILACPTQEAPLTSNTAAAKVTMWIQQYASQVYQCCEIVNAEEILKQQLLQSLDEKHSRVSANRTSTILQGTANTDLQGRHVEGCHTIRRMV